MASSPTLNQSPPDQPDARRQTPRWVLVGAALAVTATLVLHGAALVRPMLVHDDFEILSASWTWERTLENLWRPANEHTMPLGRLTTWLLVQVAGGPTGLPFVAALQGPLAVVLAMGLVYLFVRRELGRPAYGLIAMALFGVSTQYEEAVRWFAASFTVLAFDTTLLALLSAQRWRQTRRPMHLLLSAVWSALAPCWFASGIFAGPLCFLYLLPDFAENKDTRRRGDKENDAGCSITLSPCHLVTLSRKIAIGCVPILGTGLFLAVTLPRNAEHIMHLEHYQLNQKTAVQAFHLDVGLGYTARALIDNLLLGSFGIGGVNCPIEVVVPLLGVLAAAAIVWWRRAPCRRLLLLGLGFVFLSYVLTYSARAEWPYPQVSAWSRYQLLPHLGLVLFVCGGLPRYRDWLLQDWLAPDAGPRRWLALLLLVRVCEILFITQLPRGLFPYHDPQQAADLRRIEEVDARCVEYHIAAATARAALPQFRVKGSGTRDNGWDFLYGSPDPEPMPIWEVRRILNDIAAPSDPSER